MILEFIMLRVLLILITQLLIRINLEFIMYYLVFVVCERVLGLTLLLILIRLKGNDRMKVLNLILW